MPRTVQFEGTTHQFPDGATDAEISSALESHGERVTSAQPVAKAAPDQQVRGYIPGIAPPGAPPLPPDLGGPNDSKYRNLRTGRVTTAPTDTRIPILDAPITGAGEIKEGAETMSNPDMEQKAHGLHQIVQGAFDVATPLMAGGLVAAPAATAVGIGTGMLAQTGAQAGLEYVGVPKGYAEIAGDAAGLVAGGAAGKRVQSTPPRLKLSDFLPTPEQADAQTSANAHQFAVAATTPPVGNEPVMNPAQNPLKPIPSTVAPETEVQPVQPPEEKTSHAVTVEPGQSQPQKEAVSTSPETPDAPVERVAREPERSTTAAVAPANADAQKEELKPAENAPAAATINSRERSTAAAPVDARATGTVDTGGTREGGTVHGPGAASPRRVAGEDTDVLVPGEDRSIRARYEVRELSDFQPSHNGETFSANDQYAHHNERDYSKPENQQRVIDNSSEERFNPRYHITDNPDATNGPAVVDEAGNALGGNSRGMILQRVYGRNQNGAAGYRGLLEKKAAHYGIDPEAVRGMKQPVLLRVVPDKELHSLPGGSKWAIRKTNVSGTAALSSSERSAADAGQLSPDLIQHLASAIEERGPDATLNDALTGPSGTAIANKLIASGFFSEQQRPELMDGKTGVLTQLAKDRISKAMVGQFFRDSDQIARSPLALKAKLERIAAPLSKVQGDPEWDLTPAIREAVDLNEYATAHGIKNLNDVTAQQGMFSNTPQWNHDAVRIAELLRDAKPNDLVSAIRRYVNDREPTMFGESTPHEAFSQHFGGTKREFTTPAPLAQSSDAKPAPEREKQEIPSQLGITAPPSPERTTEVPATPPAPAPETESLPDTTELPKGTERADHPSDMYFGSGLGALEPLFREAKAEGDALRMRRAEALAAAKAAESTPGQTKYGEAIRSYFTSERDLWAAKANQAIDLVTRKIMPRIEDREALGIMREFRHREGELKSIIDGTHPILDGLSNPDPLFNHDVAMAQREKLMPVLKNALRMINKPTPMEAAADRVFTNIAAKSLAEGQAGGWLGSRWQNDEYVPHLLNPQGEGEVAKMPSTTGRVQGKIGKFFQFGLRRSDPYPTNLHAVLGGIIPKTLDPAVGFTAHADKFAQARATHLLEEHLAQIGLGKWGDGKHVPEGWVQLAQHSDEFKKDFVQEDERTGESRVGKLGLYVPEFIDKALSPITDPDWTSKIWGVAKVRTAQRGLKEAILSLSGFHLLTENAMAAADIGPTGMLKAFRAKREGLNFLRDEQELIASGGTTSIQGSTMNAYRGLQPGTIPTRGEILRAYIPGSKYALELADKITYTTFDNVQRRFKVASFALHRNAWMHDNPNATPAQFAEAKRGIASYVNGVYGGLHWENMGIPKAMVEIARLGFLAPDWTGSNIALGKYAVDAKPSAAELLPGRGRLAGATTKETAQARLSRAFWTKQIIGGLIGTEMLSLMFSGTPSKRPFQVYLGKDKDGQEIYQNVLFRGSAGDLVNLIGKWEDHGILTGTGVFVGGKAAPITKLASHIWTGRDDMGHEIAPKKNSAAANTVRAVGSAISDVSPVPIVARSVKKQFTGDDSDKYLWSERMLSLMGPQAQHVAPDGTRMGKNGLEYAPPKRDRSFWEQVTK